jgi:hypothetical protein
MDAGHEGRIGIAPEELDVRTPPGGELDGGGVEERDEEVDPDRGARRERVELRFEVRTAVQAREHADGASAGDRDGDLGRRQAADPRLLQRVPAREQRGDPGGDGHGCRC